MQAIHTLLLHKALFHFFFLNLYSLDVNMTTDFLVESQPGSGHTWTARIKAESRNGKSGLISFFVYLYKEPTQGEMSFVGSRKQGTVEEIFGHMPQVKYLLCTCTSLKIVCVYE